MKHLLNHLFVPALTSRPIAAIATRLFGVGIPVFMIHRLKMGDLVESGITPGHLRRCLRHLVENGYNFVSLDELILAIREQAPLPDKPVVFTMDDGFIEQARIAAPIFLEFDCPLTFFVITDMLDQTIWPWDAKVSWIIDNSPRHLVEIRYDDELLRLELTSNRKRRLARQKMRNFIKEIDAELIPDLLHDLVKAADVTIPDTAPPSYQAFDWDIARNLEKQGIRFAPHSRTHRILSKLNDEAVEDEILGSWRTLDKELSNPLKVFCYPTGRYFDYGPRELDILKQSDFLGAVSTLPGYIDIAAAPDHLLFSLPRFALPESMTYFIQYCSWIEHANWTSTKLSP